MPDFTQRVLTFIKVSSSDCLLTRRRLCAGDNAGHSPVGPQRRLTIIRPQENRKVARCSGGGTAAWPPAPLVEGRLCGVWGGCPQQAGRQRVEEKCLHGSAQEQSCSDPASREPETPTWVLPLPYRRPEPPACIILRGGIGTQPNSILLGPGSTFDLLPLLGAFAAGPCLLGSPSPGWQAAALILPTVFSWSPGAAATLLGQTCRAEGFSVLSGAVGSWILCSFHPSPWSGSDFIWFMPQRCDKICSLREKQNNVVGNPWAFVLALS